MTRPTFRPALLLAVVASLAAAAPLVAAPGLSPAAAPAEGVNRVKSLHGFDDSITRLKADLAKKGIPVFADIDQAGLGAGAGIAIPRSHLLLFGNPPLGVQFLAANPLAGLDWPVRMLVVDDGAGQVWIAWTDFDWLRQRYALTGRDAQLKMAAEVSASVASSVTR
jgi:uncharacterized protein (DUF302 family)